MKLANKIAVITGAESGIGQAVAVAFAKEGADVIVTYLHDQAGAEATKRFVEGEGRRALIVQTDVRDPAQVAELFAETERQLGTPFILINDAGLDATGDEVADMKLEDWDDRIKTNLYGPFYCCQLFIRARRRAGAGARSSTSPRSINTSHGPEQRATTPERGAAKPYPDIHAGACARQDLTSTTSCPVSS